MASRDEETRLLIAHLPGTAISGQCTTGNMKGTLLSLRHPNSGCPTSYFLINGSLQEFHWFKQSYGSWFTGEYVCEDGGLYTATPVDPVFILLPIFDEARLRRENDPGKFRQLDEIMFVDGYPGYQHLLPIVENSMQVVCEIKEIGSLKFYRLDDSKVLAWLCHKVHQLKLTLPTLDKNYAAQDDKDTLTDAVSLLGEYLKAEPWLKLLCQHLRLDMEAATRKAPIIESLSVGLEKAPVADHPLPMQNGNGKSMSSNGRQPKKMKSETSSQNIKDMFHRVTRQTARS